MQVRHARAAARRACAFAERLLRPPTDFREDADGQDHHAGGGVERHHRQREGQDSGQGGCVAARARRGVASDSLPRALLCAPRPARPRALGSCAATRARAARHCRRPREWGRMGGRRGARACGRAQQLAETPGHLRPPRARRARHARRPRCVRRAWAAVGNARRARAGAARLRARPGPSRLPRPSVSQRPTSPSGARRARCEAHRARHATRHLWPWRAPERRDGRSVARLLPRCRTSLISLLAI
jgi:hypothetical protein